MDLRVVATIKLFPSLTMSCPYRCPADGACNPERQIRSPSNLNAPIHTLSRFFSCTLAMMMTPSLNASILTNSSNPGIPSGFSHKTRPLRPTAIKNGARTDDVFGSRRSPIIRILPPSTGKASKNISLCSRSPWIVSHTLYDPAIGARKFTIASGTNPQFCASAGRTIIKTANKTNNALKLCINILKFVGRVL